MAKIVLKIILNKDLQYNILSLINVFIGFLFILYLGRKFGAGKETDVYFLSVVIVTYLGYFVQSVWEAMSPYYAEIRVENKQKAGELYSVLLNDLIIIALVIIFVYFVISNIFDVFLPTQKHFLDIFIFYLLFQNILLFNKTILNLEHFYASFYLVDIFVFSCLFLVVFCGNNIINLAYTILASTFLANLYQFYLIFRKIGLRYMPNFYDSSLKEIYKNSFKLKVGSLFYGVKDIVIASVFTSFGVGVYSLFSYASKFASVILQVVNAPIVNIFTAKANYMVANKEYNKLKQNIKKVLFRTVSLFISASIITYFLLPYVLSIVFGNKFSFNDIEIIQRIFLVMILFDFIIILESPFARLIAIIKNFDYILILNCLFALLLLTAFGLFKVFHFGYMSFLCCLVLAQTNNLLLAYKNYKEFLRIKNEI